MTIRDRLRKKPSAPTCEPDNPDPIWVHNGTPSTRELYFAAKIEFERINNLIISGGALKSKDQRIVLARIATIANKDRSLLHVRRQPELCDWIDRMNTELNNLLSIFSQKTPIRNRKSKRELEIEVSVLKRERNNIVERERRWIVEEFFSSNLLDDRDKLARENSRLRLENCLLNEKITKLQHENRERALFLGAVLNILTPSQHAQLKLWGV